MTDSADSSRGMQDAAPHPSNGVEAPAGAESIAEHAAEYTRRLQEREARVARLSRQYTQISFVRLAILAIFVGMAWAVYRHHALRAWWLLLPVACFSCVAIAHVRLLRRRDFAMRAVAVYSTGLARMEDRWSGAGQQEPRGDFAQSLYAADLDLFGRDSMFALLSRARTRLGEDTLAAWLLAPTSVAEIQQRHAAATELCSLLDMREELAVLGSAARIGVHPDALLQWSEERPLLPKIWLRWVAAGFAVCAVLTLALGLGRELWTPFFLTVVMEACLMYALRREQAQIFAGAEHALQDLDLLADSLARFEREPFHTPRLLALQAALRSHGRTASVAIAKLRKLADYIESRDNLFVRVLNIPLLYSVQVAYVAEAWRRTHGSAVRSWLATFGEMEALVSIATYQYEHPADVLPEFVEGSPRLEADNLGHPLLPTKRCVRNSLQMGRDARVLLISGSNMSGKSTLLRAVGLNTVLAMSGCPVRARRFALTPLHVGASILVNDSLAEGSSRFYAEIKRLRAICDRAGQSPTLLFLLDELLEGTNSRDRRIGAEGILRTLVECSAIGLATTHDLALTDMGSDLGFRNLHFEDAVEDGRMIFDFRLREGVVTRSNGVELMRMVGLRV